MTTLNNQVSIASVCYAGLPHHADYMVGDVDAKNVLVVQPDMNTYRVLPYASKTAVVMGNLTDQYTHAQSAMCTRTLLQNVLHEAQENHNIAFNVGIELEFCLVDAETGKFVDDSVYGNTTTLNQQEQFIADLHEQLEQQYIPIELIHSESGPGQLEVVLQYSPDALEMADNVVLAQETIKAVARRHGMKALLAPKYDMTKAGNGMHIHMSMRDAATGQSLMGKGHGVAGFSSMGEAFVEGILRRLPALMGLSLPTVNSFRRVGKGCWTGSVVGWALEDKESGLRVCSNLSTNEWDHVEYKLCDSTANLYLVLAGLFSSGLHGLEQKLELRPAIGDNAQCHSTMAEEPAPLPGTVKEALHALECDDLLTKAMPLPLGRSYLALRRAEADRSADMTLEEEVAEFLARA